MTVSSRLQSMTGFARVLGEDGSRTWSWEVKSVNGKGLDVRCRLPLGAESLEAGARALTAERFKRGNIALALTLHREAGRGLYRVNEDLLRHLIDTVTAFESGHIRFERPSLDRLMTVKGVVEPVEDQDDSDTQKRERETRMLEDLALTLDALADMRAGEGARLGVVLNEQLDEIERLTGEAASLAENQPNAIRARFAAQVSEILGAASALSEERLLQEVAILATRADVREELDRLRAHLAAARQLLKDGAVVGRKLDFLCQEFTREANTLCSKAQDVEMTRIGIDLKTVIEQFREQVQNIE